MVKKRNMKMYIVLLTGLLMITFVLIHVGCKEIQYDEAYTYIYYASNFHIKDIPYFYTKSLANNHWLNTVLIKMVQDFFGLKYNECLIRIPNVLAAIVYVGTVFRMYYKKYINEIVAVLCFINCALVDLFSQARGYGLAVGWIMLAFMFYFDWLKEEKDYYITLALISFTFSTVAITTGIFLFFVFCCVVIGKMIKKGQLVTYIKKNIVFVSIVFVLELIMLKFSFNIQSGSNPVPTNNSSAFTALFVNLFKMYFENSQLSILCAVILCATLLFAIIKVKNSIWKTDFLIVDIGYIILLICLKIVLRIDYPVIRLLTLSVPVFLLTVNEMESMVFKDNRKVKCITMCVAIGLMMYFCYRQVNIIRSFDFESKQLVYEAAFEGKSISQDDENYNPIVQFYCNKLQNDNHVTVIKE